MEYAQKILAKSGQLEGKRRRNKRYVHSVACAYCGGNGVDPMFGSGSHCPVCGGARRIKVAPPVVTCLRCSGTGREGGRLSCLACRGTGVASVRKDATTCPKCKGTGKDGVFYCSPCKGQGIASPGLQPERRSHGEHSG